MTHPDNLAAGAGRLTPLSDLPDFDVADGYTDVRGFDTYTDDGRKVGKVHELLVDAGARRVAALTVDLDDATGRTAGHAGDPRVPVEDVEIDSSRNRVMLRAGAFERLGAMRAAPAGEAAHLGHRGEAAGLDRDHKHAGRDEAHLTLAEEQVAVGKREVAAGEVQIGKRVETERVHEEVPVRREEVTIERRPAEPGMVAEGARIEEDEVRIPLKKEEVVVEKRVVPTEELVVKKHDVTEREEIDETVRRERAEIDRGQVVEGDRNLDKGMRAGEHGRGPAR